MWLADALDAFTHNLIRTSPNQPLIAHTHTRHANTDGTMEFPDTCRVFSLQITPPHRGTILCN